MPLLPFASLWDDAPNEIKIAILKHAPLDTLKSLLPFHELKPLARQALIERVNDIMELFHLRPRVVLEMMESTGTVLSGSAALQVVSPSLSWKPSDLDFYCGFNDVQDVVYCFAGESYEVSMTFDAPYACKKFYTYAPASARPANFEARFCANSCIEKVYTLVHRESKLTINVIQSRSPASAAPLAFFHSTLVMNMVSANGVVCAYPDLTLNSKGLMNFQTMPPIQPVHLRDILAVDKYQQRGYSFVQGDDHDITVDGDERVRSWRDPWSSRMRFRSGAKVIQGANATLSWRTSFRQYFNWGIREHAPEVLVEEDQRLVCYRNWVGPAHLAMSSRPSRARRVA
ncbi:hypothetical protein FA13DRAFT_1803064 [Coprinellus micaceus]|uniref:Uncharacterized protein n=1 Tax=Coprinellus micaceus TaxID=71717 RepID=A0A4Y7SBQ1_COPMI|nr:hypothetical protein FA13DRAFT_1803064 [Coprinellus micaceus]